MTVTVRKYRETEKVRDGIGHTHTADTSDADSRHESHCSDMRLVSWNSLPVLTDIAVIYTHISQRLYTEVVVDHYSSFWAAVVALCQHSDHPVCEYGISSSPKKF